MVFSSEYDVRCTDIQSQVSQTAITNVVNHHYKQIENICANGKPIFNMSYSLISDYYKGNTSNIQVITILPAKQIGLSAAF